MMAAKEGVVARMNRVECDYVSLVVVHKLDVLSSRCLDGMQDSRTGRCSKVLYAPRVGTDYRGLECASFALSS
jgi:hypothetical protein